MRKWIILILLVLPQIGFSQSQTERAQKQAKVVEKRTQSQTQWNPNTNQRPPSYNRPPRVYRPYYYNPYVWGWTPYWNPHRNWDNRTYIVTTDENRITTQRPPLRVSIGVLSEVTTQTPTLSPYLILGGKTFLITQYHWGGGNSYPHYDNIYQWEVDEWEDEPMGTPSQRTEFVLGLGTTYGRLSPFVGFGFGKKTQWDAYKDETYTLSSIRDLGIYTINKKKTPSNSIKVGALYAWDRWEVMGQISLPYGNEVSGLRIGLGIGLKL